MSQSNAFRDNAKGLAGRDGHERLKGKGRILLVDDDDLFREVMSENLRMNGYQVDCAEDGKAGWDVFLKKKYDLLITDQNMPKLSGIDLLRRVRAGRHDLPVMLMSGYMPYQGSDLSGLISPDEVLAKPFCMKDMLRKVDTFLRGGPPKGQPRIPLTDRPSPDRAD